MILLSPPGSNDLDDINEIPSALGFSLITIASFLHLGCNAAHREAGFINRDAPPFHNSPTNSLHVGGEQVMDAFVQGLLHAAGRSFHPRSTNLVLSERSPPGWTTNVEGAVEARVDYLNAVIAVWTVRVFLLILNPD